MGNLTVKESGEMINFISPNVSKITSFKVHFSPKQEGTGDPSPENVREITGWNGVEVGLPSEYQEVEYIENIDQAFIMTNFWSGEVGSVDIDFYYVSYRQWANLLGTSDKTSNPHGSCLLLTHSNKFRMSAYGRVNNIETDPLTIGNRYKINAVFKSGNQSLTINNKLIGTNNYVWETSIPYMSLFGIYYGAQYSKPLERALVRIYSCTFYDNNEKIIEHFVPCYRKSDNEIGMYGTITKTFYTNAGTGTFLKGANVNKIQTSIDWTEDVGTVYGGYVDLVTGELVETWKLRQISELGVKKTSGTGIWEHRFDMKYWVTGYGYETSGTFECLTDCFTLGLADHNNSFLTYVGNLSVYDDTVSTADEFKAKYGQNYIAYKIKSDLWQTHQLTPQQLSTLKGQNNFWSNADYVEIEYELTETFDIQKAKRKIILNQPHVESTSGTIAKPETDMIGKIKECKIHFMPVQQDDSDPTPDNIVPVTGWTGIDVYQAFVEYPITPIVNTTEGYGVKWVVDKDGLMTAYGTPTAYTGANLGTINVNGDETLYGIVAGSLNNVTFNKPTLLNSNNKSVAYTAGDGILQTGLDLSLYEDVKKVRISLKRSGNVFMSGSCNTIVWKDKTPTVSSTTTIDWTNVAGTIYGGYVDLISGELVQEFKQCKINELSWSYFSDGACFATSKNTPNDLLKDKSLLISYIRSNYYTPIDGYGNISTYADKQDYSISLYASSDQHRIVIKDSRFTDVSSFLSAMGDTYIWYRLAEPTVTYQLTPQQLTTLRGINNIWSSANGEVEIKYWKH